MPKPKPAPRTKAVKPEESSGRPTSDEVRSEVFVEKYLTCWNATQAAREAGYKNPNKIGPRKLVEVGIQQAIKERLKDLQASADEVIIRLTNHSRASIEYFLDESNEISLEVARQNNALGLIKKLKRTRRTEPRGKDQEPVVITTLEIELHDAQSATVQMGKIRGLFVEKSQEMNWENEIIELLKTGKLTQARLWKELPNDAGRLIIASGVRPDDGAQAEAGNSPSPSAGGDGRAGGG